MRTIDEDVALVATFVEGDPEAWAAFQRIGTALISGMSAPPAAAVPDGYALVPVQSLRWWRELAEINPQDLVPRIDAMLADAERKGG